MSSIFTLLSKVMSKHIEKNEEKILWAMPKVNEGGDMEDIDTIVTDYFYLVKKVHGRKKPAFVAISLQNHNLLIVDDVIYDLNILIRHNDLKNTERKMEIDVLLSDGIPIDEVQRQLNEKIREEW